MTLEGAREELERMFSKTAKGDVLDKDEDPFGGRFKTLEDQNSKLQKQLNDLQDEVLQKRLKESKIDLEARLDIDPHESQLSIVELREQNEIAEERSRLLSRQLRLLDDILRAEKKLTEEVKVQLTIEELREQKREAYLKKYGQSEGMRATSAGIDLSRTSHTSEKYAEGEYYTRKSGEHTIIFTGNKSGL